MPDLIPAKDGIFDRHPMSLLDCRLRGNDELRVFMCRNNIKET